MAKKVAKKVTKKRVRKNVERGQAHIQSSFNNTIVTLTDTERKRHQLGERRWSWIQRFKEIYSLCSTDGCGNCRKGGASSRLKERGRIRKGTRLRP